MLSYFHKLVQIVLSHITKLCFQKEFSDKHNINEPKMSDVPRSEIIIVVGKWNIVMRRQSQSLANV